MKKNYRKLLQFFFLQNISYRHFLQKNFEEIIIHEEITCQLKFLKNNKKIFFFL